MEDLFQLSQTQIRLFNKPYKRYLLVEPELSTRVCLILGQRGIGKTTAMVQHLLDQTGQDALSGSILYVQADHFQIRDRNLYEIAEYFVNMGGKTICLDEIHKYPGWSMELKSMADTFPGLKILASGSSALEVTHGSHDLSRRALQITMRGMSFREYLELKLGVELSVYGLDAILQDHVRLAHTVLEQLGENKVLPHFKAYLRHGYYPFYFEEENEAIFNTLLNQNLHTTLESDLMSVYPKLTGSSIKKINRLLRIISSSVPFVADMKKIGQLTEIHDLRTLKSYLKYLEDTGLILGLCRSARGLRAMEKPEKIFLNNSNLMYAFGGGTDIGSIRETFFMNTLGAKHEISAPDRGDFLVEGNLVFEVGGRKKDFTKIRNIPGSFLALDDLERGFGKKIPLWLFGFLY